MKNIAEKFASVQQNAAAGRPIDVLLFNRQMRNGPFAGIAIEGHPVDCVPGEALIDLDHKLFTGIKITFALAAHVYELPLAIRLGIKVKLVSFVVDDSHESWHVESPLHLLLLEERLERVDESFE